MSPIEGLLYGMCGGFFTQLFGLFKLRHEGPENLPDYLVSPFFWIISITMIIVGGLIVIIYLNSGMELNPLLSVNIGASAPLIIERLASQFPAIPPGRID